MANKTVLLTGLTSFTGTALAECFLKNGWTVYGFCSQSLASYSGLKALRLKRLQAFAHRLSLSTSSEGQLFIQDQCQAERGDFAAWLRAWKGAGVWIHHHHWMEQFRSLEAYDQERAWKVGIPPLDELAKVLAEETSISSVLVSGSYFEPGEGGEGDPIRTPYALSKQKVWKRWQELSKRHSLSLAKVVIPNPVGPGENEDRLSSVLLEKARRREPLFLKSPESRSDFLPVSSLAQVYEALASSLLENTAEKKPPLLCVVRPSGLQTSYRKWVELMNQELLIQRLGWPPVDIQEPSVPTEKIVYANPVSEAVSLDWASFWDRYRKGIV